MGLSFGGVLLGCPRIVEGWVSLGKAGLNPGVQPHADVGMEGPQNCAASASEQGWWQLDTA